VEVVVRRLATEVLAQIAADREVTQVAIKVRFVPFFTVTRVHKLASPTRDLEQVQQEAVDLLERVERDRPIRLLGVRLTLTEPPG
jgi:DNA polymerase-4